MPAKLKDLVIEKGKTFEHVVRWEGETFTYSAITAITKAAPCVVTAAAHGVPDQWKVAVVSAGGMSDINASTPPSASQYITATRLTDNTIELNSVNSAGYKTYTSGGYLQFKTPVPLAGYTARMSIKDKVGGTELLRLDTTTVGIVIDDVTKTISLSISAALTSAATWTKGVYDLELVSASGVVTALLAGKVAVTSEVTTT